MKRKATFRTLAALLVMLFIFADTAVLQISAYTAKERGIFDLDGDKDIGQTDIALLTDALSGNAGSTEAFDLDKDGFFNTKDLTLLLNFLSGDYKVTPCAHEFGEWAVTKEASCTEKGVNTRVCAICGEEETEELQMTDHTPVIDEAVEATETATGLTEGSHCSVCGTVLVPQQIIPATGNVDVNAKYETLDELGDRLNLTYGLPSTGDVELLVIPIGFTNSKYANVKETLELGFNGTKEETGWHSLRSYYNEVSFGKLNFHATILDTYETGVRYDLKKGATEKDDYKYLEGALTFYDDQIDYSKYDQNNDGYIDCVYLVYLAPYMTDEKHSDLWWAYTYEFYEQSEEIQMDGVGIDWYMWFSIEFFTEDILEGKTNAQLGLKVNAETVIHETGHALGLDDYYDYVDDNVTYGGLGGQNMMDWNQGDHDPFSKAILGWINPTVVRGGTYETTLSSFTTTGDALFIAREGNGTFFDEFYIVIYYTPEGVNELKAESNVGVIGKAGVLVYHVNSTMVDNPEGIIDIYKHNNGEKTDRLIKIVGAHGNYIDKGYAADSQDLFGKGGSVSLKWNDGTSSGYTIKVSDIVKNENATISIVSNN